MKPMLLFFVLCVSVCSASDGVVYKSLLRHEGDQVYLAILERNLVKDASFRDVAFGRIVNHWQLLDEASGIHIEASIVYESSSIAEKKVTIHIKNKPFSVFIDDICTAVGAQWIITNGRIDVRKRKTEIREEPNQSLVPTIRTVTARAPSSTLCASADRGTP